MPRLLLTAGAVVAVASAGAAGATSATPRLKSPQLAEIARGPAAIRDAVIDRRTPNRRLAAVSVWGGTYTAAATGEAVSIYASDSYPQDPAIGQRWADFLASLIHGSELSNLTVYLQPLDELQRTCGPQTLGCYSGDQHVLIAPGDDPSTATSAEAVITHEYGHHVAANRLGSPWPAIDYGTKRWASYENVCARAAAGEIFPGSETLPSYRLNPGEAFAETYRVLNERRAGLAEAPWRVVDQSFYPDDSALTLVEQDVTSPWQGSTLTTRTGAVGKGTRIRSFTIPTPLDGMLRVRLRAPSGSRLAYGIYTSSTTRVAHAVTARTATLTTTICGQRSVQIRVGRVTGGGPFQLSIATP